ncbi:MAG: tubulin-like doman-containing protein [Ruminococcus sp.]
MSMNQMPTLVVGIGGIGCRIAANISDMLSDEDRKYVGVVGMDTNVNDIKHLADHKMKIIQTSDERTVREYIRKNPRYAEWFPINKFTLDRGMVNGAGQVRAISRLAAIAAEESGKFTPLKDELQRIREQHGENINKNLAVIIVGSITGGTGAGLFIQLPFYIRKILKNSDGLNSVIIRGMFIGPDITAGVQPSNVNKDAVRINGYACLKELNALYMTQSKENPNLKFEYYEHPDKNSERRTARHIRSQIIGGGDEFYGDDVDVDADVALEDAAVIAQRSAYIPYDYLYLIEGTTASGGIGETSITNIESHVGKMVFTLMFTPISDNALSVEDNMVLQDMETNGMNRYSSAGLCRLIFPCDIAKEYVTRSLVQDLVQQEWTIIDTKYNDTLLTARANQKTDGLVEMPKLIPTFTSTFENEINNGSLGNLFKEVYIVDEHRNTICRSESFLSAIEENVDHILSSDDVVKAKAACRFNESRMRKTDTAKSEISKTEIALEDYRILARNLAKQKELEVANNMFPTSWQSMNSSKKSPDCIYQWLYNVHPLTGRYLCYDLITRLQEKVEELEVQLESVNLNFYDDTDFDPKKPKTQHADDIVKELHEKRLPILGHAFNESGKLTRLRIKFEEAVTGQLDAITEYLKTSLMLSACRILLKRMEMLADNYYLFFQTLTDTMAENDKKLNALENNKMPFGQLGIYCSREALRHMAEEYKSSVQTELPEDTKQAVFENIFRLFATDFSNEFAARTEQQKEKYVAEKKKKLGNIFRTAIVDTIRTDVAKKGTNIVDLDIKSALCKQMELEKGITNEDPEAYETACVEYIRSYLQKGMNIAFPMLAVDAATMAHNTESVYIALNPECAVLQDGKPHPGATLELYYPQADENTDNIHPTPLMDDEFSPYEIICFKARYKFSIEDLIKYREKSENAVAYHKRISNLGKTTALVNGYSTDITVVNPHINRYWHEPGFLPAISAEERIRVHENILKAFIYSMGYDNFTLDYNDDLIDEDNEPKLMWKVAVGGASAFVKSKGRYIGNNYADVYNALPFNSKIVDRILGEAHRKMERLKGRQVANELFEEITQNPFIVDLAQPEEVRLTEDDANIIDIFMDMRQNIDIKDWFELFDALRITLWEYLSYMFDDNQKMVNEAYRSVLDLIVENCAITAKQKAGEKLRYSETQAIEQIKRITQMRFTK